MVKCLNMTKFAGKPWGWNIFAVHRLCKDLRASRQYYERMLGKYQPLRSHALSTPPLSGLWPCCAASQCRSRHIPHCEVHTVCTRGSITFCDAAWNVQSGTLRASNIGPCSCTRSCEHPHFFENQEETANLFGQGTFISAALSALPGIVTDCGSEACCSWTNYIGKDATRY